MASTQLRVFSAASVGHFRPRQAGRRAGKIRANAWRARVEQRATRAATFSACRGIAA